MLLVSMDRSLDAVAADFFGLTNRLVGHGGNSLGGS